MFDTPDLGPMCLAPWIAALVALLVRSIGPLFELKLRRQGFERLWSPVIALVIAPVVCFASFALNIGARDPAPWFKPASTDIIGKWRLSPDPTDQFLDSAQHPLPARELVFYENGTFRAEGIPDMWSYTDLSALNHVSYISGSGTWHLGQVQGTERLEWVLFTQFQEVNGHGDNRGMRYYFQGHLPPYRLATLDSGYRIFHFHRN